MNIPSLFIKVSDEKTCLHCKVVKNGTTKNKKQQYHCKGCGKRFIIDYSYSAYLPDVNQNIIQFTKEGLGIRSTARILQISTTTLLKRIVSITRNIPKPLSAKAKVMKSMSCVLISGTKETLSGWCML